MHEGRKIMQYIIPFSGLRINMDSSVGPLKRSSTSPKSSKNDFFCVDSKAETEENNLSDLFY